MLQDTPGGNMHATVSAHLLLASQEHRVQGCLKDTEAGFEPRGRSRCVTYRRCIPGGALPHDRTNHSELTEDSASRSRDSFLGLKIFRGLRKPS